MESTTKLSLTLPELLSSHPSPRTPTPTKKINIKNNNGLDNLEKDTKSNVQSITIIQYIQKTKLVYILEQIYNFFYKYW